MTSPLRGPENSEGGGFAAADSLRRTAGGCGPAPGFDKGTLARTLTGLCGQVTSLPDRRRAYGSSPLVKFLHRRRRRASRSMQVTGARRVYPLGLSPPSWRIIARSSRIAQRSVIRPSTRRYANITSREKRPGERSKPRNEPPGQSSSREPNWTTKSFSAAISDHSHRAGRTSRRAVCKNSRVPSMPCGRPGARA